MFNRTRFILVVFLLTVPGISAQAAPFKFAFITDSHVGNAKATPLLLKVVDDINSQEVAFVVHGGDITNIASPDEFAKAKEILSRLKTPFFTVNGNHDAKWAPGGGRIEHKEYFGKPSCSSHDYNGFRFFFLDPTVPLTGMGHFDRKQLEWLKTELAKKPDAPVFIFFHYPLEAKDIDNIPDFREIIAPYRVAAYVVGHGHSNRKTDRDGIPEIMGRDTYGNGGGYNLFTVDEKSFTVATKPLGQPVKEPWVTAEIPARGEPGVDISSPKQGERVSGSMQIMLRVTDDKGLSPYEKGISRPTAGRDVPKVTSAKATIDGTGEHILGPVKNSAAGMVDVSELPGGLHKLDVTVTLGDGRILKRRVHFYTDNKSPKALWRFDTGSDILSSPAADSERVYAAAMDGNLYAIDARDGKLHWSFPTGNYLYSTPCVDGRIVYVGSTDGKIYALNAVDGRKLWSYETGSPVMGSPVTTEKLVVVGAGKEMIALDKTTGELKWKSTTGALIDSKPAVSEGMIIFGAWDRCLHALSAVDGKEVWKTQLGSIINFSPANCWPALAYNKVFVTTPNKETFGIDVMQGNVAWSLENQAYDSIGAGGELVFTRGLDGKLNAYVPTGQLRWSVDGGWGWDNAPSMPQAAGNRVYTGCKRGYVSAYNLEDGAVQWKYQAGKGWMLSTVVPTGNGVIFATTLDGMVTAIQE